MKYVEAKVQDLRALAKSLEGLIRACRAGQPTDQCPILNSLEQNRRINDGKRKANN